MRQAVPLRVVVGAKEGHRPPLFVEDVLKPYSVALPEYHWLKIMCHSPYRKHRHSAPNRRLRHTNFTVTSTTTVFSVIYAVI